MCNSSAVMENKEKPCTEVCPLETSLVLARVTARHRQQWRKSARSLSVIITNEAAPGCTWMEWYSFSALVLSPGWKVFPKPHMNFPGLKEWVLFPFKKPPAWWQGGNSLSLLSGCAKKPCCCLLRNPAWGRNPSTIFRNFLWWNRSCVCWHLFPAAGQASRCCRYRTFVPINLPRGGLRSFFTLLCNHSGMAAESGSCGKNYAGLYVFQQ